MPELSTMYGRAGGERFFEELTTRFYREVAVDPLLRPLYPADDGAFEASRLHLKWFLIQYWGGPQVYAERRGEPRLRMRHAPFKITAVERDAWYRHMSDAVKAAGLKPLDETQMLGYFASAATAMINAEAGAGPQDASFLP
jgi:hemoglobin